MSQEHADNRDPVDIAVGTEIRTRRLRLGLSQAALAAALGLTFQQVQKYESGTNRISASKLYKCAATLKCLPGDLFPDQVAESGTWLDAARRLSERNPRLIDKLSRLSRLHLGDLERIVDHMLAASAFMTDEDVDLAIQAASADPVNREAA